MNDVPPSDADSTGSSDDELVDDPLAGLVFDAYGQLIDLNQPPDVVVFGPPPDARWMDPLDVASVFGRRCALTTRGRATYDLRCASEVYESAGGQYVNVVAEAQWYRWLEITPADRPQRIPRATSVPTKHVWIEDTPQPVSGGPDGCF